MTSNPIQTQSTTFSGILGEGAEPENGSGLGDNSTLSDVGSAEHEWAAFRTIKVTVAFLVTTLIIVNNLINLIVLPQMQDLGQRMKVLLYSLTISDMCLGLMVCLPALVSGPLGYWPFGPALCQVSGTVNGVAIGVSLWSLTAISIERCVLIKKPLRSNKNQGMLYLGLGVTLIWTFSIAFFAFPILLEKNFQYYVYDNDVITCSFRWKSTTYFLVGKFMYPVLSGSIILFSSIMIHSALKRAMFDRLKWKAQIPMVESTGNGQNSFSKMRLRFKLLVGSKPTHPSTTTLNTNNNDTNPHGGNSSSTACPRETSSGPIGIPVIRENGNTPTRLTPLPGEKDNDVVMTRSMINRNLKARLLVALTSILFFTTIGPYMLTSLVAHFLPASRIPAGVKFASLWILNINSFVNFYVYSFIYAEYRRRIRALLRRVFCWGETKCVNVSVKNMQEPVTNESGFHQRMIRNPRSSARKHSKAVGSPMTNSVRDRETCAIHPTEVSTVLSQAVISQSTSDNFEESPTKPPRLVPRDDAFPAGMCTPLDSASPNKNSRFLLHPYHSRDVHVVASVDV